MPRISGVDIPEKKIILISLTYIYGIGRNISKKILGELGISESTRTKDLTEPQLNSIRSLLDKKKYTIEGELRRLVFQNVKRLKDIRCYRGLRHLANLPVRGQKTQKNARTKRGKRLAVGGVKPKAATKT